MTGDFYILEGKKAVRVDGLEEWTRRVDLENKHVAVTEIAPGTSVSTVFLGIDHNHFGGSPLLFETMVFNDYGDDGTQQRYSTWEEAEAGHARIVAEQKAKLS